MGSWLMTLLATSPKFFILLVNASFLFNGFYLPHPHHHSSLQQHKHSSSIAQYSKPTSASLQKIVSSLSFFYLRCFDRREQQCSYNKSMNLTAYMASSGFTRLVCLLMTLLKILFLLLEWSLEIGEDQWSMLLQPRFTEGTSRWRLQKPKLSVMGLSQLAGVHGFKCLIVESDAQSALNLCNENSCSRQDVDNVTFDIFSMAALLEKVSFVHVSRNCNSVAHSIAKWAIDVTGSCN